MAKAHDGVDYPLKRKVLPGCEKDFAALPTHNLRVIAMQILVDVSLGKRAGQALDEMASTGDLSDCFKVYFDERDDIKPRFRLVYRLLPDGGVDAVIVEAVAVGQRAALDAYVRAAKRLGRLDD